MLRIKKNLLSFLIFNSLFVQTLFADQQYSPEIAAKSAEGELAIHAFKLPGGMNVQLFAAEPMLANPVAFCFDERGRVYVAETFRQQKGVEDNRGHMNWLLDDLAAQTVADRLVFFKKYIKDDIQKYGLEHDRIRLLEDVDGDGKADKSTVFADGFNAIEDGTGAGVLALNGTIYYTCIPKLWTLNDLNEDGVADQKTALYDGFGVRVAFRGHDMHGLILGPDGRIYFSIGDRGFNVELKDKTRLANPDQGAVFRCEPDGSKLEIFCRGLRNPQELAFDEYGNLFTGDNNSDGGDRARWTYLMEGSDTGWRMYYQYLEDRGPWSREKLWHTQHTGQAAYIVPPIAHFANGPSGLAYYPGTGLDEKYQGHFFLADFRGQSSNSGIRSFAQIPKGASFELVNPEEFIWSILATDVDFGFDGGLYVSDWVDGWEGKGKGRLYRFSDVQHGQSEAVKQVSKLMKEGFESRPLDGLTSLLEHSDYRIRQRAQLALVQKKAVNQLVTVASSGKKLVARLHAIWGIGQLGRQNPEQLKSVLPLLEDKEPEVRAQAAKVCGDANYQESAVVLTKLVKDSNVRVRSLAAIAIGKLHHKPAVIPLFEALAENADSDPWLRHALVMGLVGTATPEELIATSRMPVTAIRLGAVVALRRMANPGLKLFVNDSDSLVILEAVRAIHDLRISEAMPSVAGLLGKPGFADPVLRRALNVNFLLGTQENAEAVASFAGNPLYDDGLRLEALRELIDWNTPGPLDRVTNEYHELPKRSIPIKDVVRPWIGSIFAASPEIREMAFRLASENLMIEAEPYLVAVFDDPKSSSAPVRVAAMRALNAMNSQQITRVLDLGLADMDHSVRSETRRTLSERDAPRAVRLLAETANSESTIEQQAAISTLTQMKRADADAVLLTWLDKLMAGKVAPEIQLDLISAATSRGTMELENRVAAFEKSRKSDDHLKDYRETLFGGDASQGSKIFYGRSDVSCRRCHKINDSGGEVGPDLSRIGLEKKREYLLESIVDPNKQIAKGFETAILQMSDGKVYAGIVKREDDQVVQLVQPDGMLISVAKSEIDERAVGKSGMPEDLVKKLTKFELRDLVEYLSTLKSGPDGSAHGEK